jgi:hypothetical protein
MLVLVSTSTDRSWSLCLCCLFNSKQAGSQREKGGRSDEVKDLAKRHLYLSLISSFKVTQIAASERRPQTTLPCNKPHHEQCPPSHCHTVHLLRPLLDNIPFVLSPIDTSTMQLARHPRYERWSLCNLNYAPIPRCPKHVKMESHHFVLHLRSSPPPD